MNDAPKHASNEVVEERRKRNREVLWTGAGLTVFVAALGYTLSHRFEGPLMRVGYPLLIDQVRPPAGGLPAIAVDFGDKLKKADGSTDAAGLNLLVDAVAKLHPKAIAVDFDCGRDPDGKSNDAAPILAQRTWKEDPQVPVYMASLSAGLPDDYWIAQGDKAWAVHPFLPSDARTGQLYIAGKLKVGDEPAMPGIIETLAAKLPTAPDRWAWLRTPKAEPIESGPIEAERVLFNPSVLDKAHEEHISAATAADLRGVGSLSEKVVIIGSSTDRMDRHGRSDREEKEYGLYFLTAGVASYGQDRLYLFHPIVQVSLDLLFGFAVVGAMQLLLRRSLHDPREVDEVKVSIYFALAAAAAVILAGIVLARLFNVLWIDFVLVAMLALAHPGIEWLFQALKNPRKRLSIYHGEHEKEIEKEND